MDDDFAKRMQAAALRFRAGESDVEEIESPNGLIRLVRDPDAPQGFRIEAEADGESISMSLRAFPPAPIRPEDYPPDLPFLADCAAMVNGTANTVSWMNPADPGTSFERLAEAIIEGGWEKVEISPVIAGSGDRRQAEFRMPGKDGMPAKERTLMLNVRDGHAHLVLMERHPPGESEES